MSLSVDDETFVFYCVAFGFKSRSSKIAGAGCFVSRYDLGVLIFTVVLCARAGFSRDLTPQDINGVCCMYICVLFAVCLISKPVTVL